MKIIVEFLNEKVFQHYKTSKNLLINNEINLFKNY